MIKQNGRSARREKSSNTFPKNQRVRMVYLEPPTAMKLDREYAKRPNRPKRLVYIVEMVSSHYQSAPLHSAFAAHAFGGSSPPTVGTTQTFTSASISWAKWILTV